jgi:hypothetical protein
MSTSTYLPHQKPRFKVMYTADGGETWLDYSTPRSKNEAYHFLGIAQQRTDQLGDGWQYRVVEAE